MNDTHQTLAITKWFAKSALQSFLIAIGISSLVAVVVWMARADLLISLMLREETEMLFTVSTQWFLIPLISIVITALVISIVNSASYSQVLIVNGATRKSVAGANLLNVVIMTVVICVFALILFVADLRLSGGGASLLLEELYSGASLMTILFYTLFVFICGMTIPLLFIRWRWPVGVIVLVVFTMVVPNVFYSIPFLSAFAVQVGQMPVTPIILSALVALAYYCIIRGMPSK